MFIPHLDHNLISHTEMIEDQALPRGLLRLWYSRVGKRQGNRQWQAFATGHFDGCAEQRGGVPATGERDHTW
jgi:hypothetical protein